MDTKADTELTQYLAEHPDKRQCWNCGRIKDKEEFEFPNHLYPVCDICAEEIYEK